MTNTEQYNQLDSGMKYCNRNLLSVWGTTGTIKSLCLSSLIPLSSSLPPFLPPSVSLSAMILPSLSALLPGDSTCLQHSDIRDVRPAVGGSVCPGSVGSVLSLQSVGLLRQSTCLVDSTKYGGRNTGYFINNNAHTFCVCVCVCVCVRVCLCVCVVCLCVSVCLSVCVCISIANGHTSACLYFYREWTHICVFVFLSRMDTHLHVCISIMTGHTSASLYFYQEWTHICVFVFLS